MYPEGVFSDHNVNPFLVLLHKSKTCIRETVLPSFLALPSCQVPMKTIASNAGVEGAVIVGKVEELEDPQMGYDAATGKWPGEQARNVDQEEVVIMGCLAFVLY